MRLPDPPILVITDRQQARHPLPDIAAAIFAGGGRWLSLRDKDLPQSERVALLHRLVEIARPYGARVMVHEDVATAAGAAGVHLPDGASAAAARRALGPAALIGCSAHDETALARAAAEGADYATLSPIFASASKPGYGPALGLDRLARAAGGAALPVIALGGIDASNAAACLAAGAAGVALMGGVMAADNPQTLMAGLIDALRGALAARAAHGS